MRAKIFILTIIFLSMFSFVYAKDFSVTDLEVTKNLNPVFLKQDSLAVNDVLYPPEEELLKQGMTLETYLESLKNTASINRNSQSSIPNMSGTMPLTGTVKVPVLLVKFSDKLPTYTQSQINDFFNRPDIQPESISVSRYYYEQSYGDLNIVFDVYDWTFMPQTFAYYALNDSREFQLILDAVTTFGSSVNFSQYDNDGNGRLDGIVIIYPDVGRLGSNGIWPHARMNKNYTGFSIQGKYLGNTALVPELGARMSNTFEIPITTHEFGHVLGLPDLYTITPSGGSNNGPISGMSMMAFQESDCLYKPINLDAWSRYFLGWINPVVLTTNDPKEISLRSVNDYPDAVILKNNNLGSREFFIIENRYRNQNDPNNLDNCMFLGFFSSYNGGLAIYHVDENKIEADFLANTVNWDPDGNFFDYTAWPGITYKKNMINSDLFTISQIDLYFNGTIVGCDSFKYFDETKRMCPEYQAIDDFTTRSYSGVLDPFITFRAISSANQYTMTAKMLVGKETETPIATPISNIYYEPIEVTLSSEPGSIIYYTLDNSTPTTSSLIYSSPIPLTQGTTTIKAIAKKDNLYVSDVFLGIYNITGTVVTPQASQSSGVVNYNSYITLTTSTPDAVIRYTLNNTEPTESSAIYTSPLLILQDTTLKAKAYKSNWQASETSTYNYQVLVSEEPESTLPSGYYVYGTSLELSTPTPNSEIRYTINGPDPTSSSPLYTEPILITINFTLKAKTFKDGFAPSLTSTYDYETGLPPENKILSFSFESINSETEINHDQNQVFVRIPYGVNKENLTPVIEIEEGASIFPDTNTSQNFNQPVTYTITSFTGERTYTITVINNPRVFLPITTILGGTFTEPIFVELSTQTPNAIIKYTTDGSFPLLSSITYTGAIELTTTTTLKAVAYLYVGTELSTSQQSVRQTLLREVSNLTPATIIWASSEMLIEQYNFTRKIEDKNKSVKEKIQIITKQETPAVPKQKEQNNNVNTKQ